MIGKTLLVDLVMLTVLICMLDMVTRRVHLWVVFFIKGEVLDCFHNVSLSQMYHSFDIIHKTLMLSHGWVMYDLFNFNWILIDLGSQFCCNFNFLMSLRNIILKD